MIPNVNCLRRPADPYTNGRCARALRFMSDNNHPSYAEDINALQAQFDEVQAEAGPNGHICEFTQASLDGIDKAIWEIAEAAMDRYEDWASDPLP